MSVTDVTCDAKVVVVGNTCVGKTCIANRFVGNRMDIKTGSTIGASFLTKKLFVDGIKMKLQIWDTAGQERFRSMVPMYYRGASAALLVYDVTDRESFEWIPEWAKMLRSSIVDDAGGLGNNIVIGVAGNKIDLQDLRLVSFEEGKKVADEIGAVFGETSAKTNQGISELFELMLKKVLRRSRGYLSTPTSELNLKKKSEPETSDSCCS